MASSKEVLSGIYHTSKRLEGDILVSKRDGKVTHDQLKQLGLAAFGGAIRQIPGAGFDAVQSLIDNSGKMAELTAGIEPVVRQLFAISELVRASPASPRIWTPDRVIQLSGVKDEAAMRAALKAAGRQIDLWASDILPQVTYTGQGPIGLKFISNEQLGITDDWVPLKATHDAGLAQGLLLCEQQDGPELAAQYGDQPLGEILRMAMPPLKVSRGRMELFVVGHVSNRRLLKGGHGHPTEKFHRKEVFAFRCK